MNITKVHCKMASIPYGSLYQLASGATKAATRVFVFIETDEGVVGVGETGATVPERGGETMEAIYANILRRFGPLIVGMNPFDIGPIIDTIEKAHWGRTGYLCVKCGIDNALYDIMGKANGQPVAQLLGGIHRTKFRVSRSIGLKPLDEMAETALKLVEKGYAMLTIKIGFDPKQDIERLAAVRDAVGDRFPLEVDANEGYRAETAVPTLKKMMRYGIESIEQPVPWWDIAGLKRVRSAIDVPITADESAYTPYDVVNLARNEAVDTICVKPIKNGGFYLSRRIAETADAAGMGVLMGSKHPMSPGTAAILHFAAAMPMVHDILGYGSPLERFPQDVTVASVEMNADGTVDLPTGPGLGVEIDPEKLARFALPDVDWPPEPTS